jgi:hypothetical protein
MNGGEVEETMRLPLRPNEDYGGGEVHWGTENESSIEVPRGRFDGCIALVGGGTMFGQPVHWTCPGVGVVREEVGACAYAAPWYNLALSELTDYDIPPVVPVP